MTRENILNLKEKRDFGQVINATFNFLRLTYKSLFKDLLYVAGPVLLLGGLISAGYQYETLTGIAGTNYYATFLALLFSVSGTTLAAIIVGNYIYHYNRAGINFDRQELWGDVKKDFLKIFITYIVYILIIGVGFVLLLVPGIFLSIALSLTMIIRILDKNKGLGDSLSESYRLLKGNWWRTFGLFLIITFISYAFALAFLIPGLVTTFMITFNSRGGMDTEDLRVVHIVLGSITQLSYLIITTIPFVAMAIYYYSLKEEWDAVGILERIETIGAENTNIKENEASY